MESKIKTSLFSIELSIDSISEQLKQYSPVFVSNKDFIKYAPISEYPTSYRDFSFSIKNPSKVEEVKITLQEAKAKFLKDLFMFDFYKNENTNEIKIGFRLIFQSHEGTLTDIQVDDAADKIIAEVLSIESVTLPGRI